MRPKHWIKNIFVFAGPFFARSLFHADNFSKVLCGVISWCLLSSAVYIFNDIIDRRNDVQHPVKKKRPLAAQSMKIGWAVFIMGITLFLGYIVSIYAGRQFIAIVTAYVSINILYTVILKHIVIIDVMCIASGFVLRVMSGAYIVHAVPSEWLIMCTMLLSLLLGFGKRKEELSLLEDNAAAHRKILREYDMNFLNHIPYALLSATIVCYMLYTVSPDTIKRFGTTNLIYTTPFVIFGLLRYVYIAYEKNKGADPTQVIIQDIPTGINIFLWIITVGYFIYL
jgi:4-hydroxybenzoate polyprenyltransferase